MSCRSARQMLDHSSSSRFHSAFQVLVGCFNQIRRQLFVFWVKPNPAPDVVLCKLLPVGPGLQPSHYISLLQASVHTPCYGRPTASAEGRRGQNQFCGSQLEWQHGPLDPHGQGAFPAGPAHHLCLLCPAGEALLRRLKHSMRTRGLQDVGHPNIKLPQYAMRSNRGHDRIESWHADCLSSEMHIEIPFDLLFMAPVTSWGVPLNSEPILGWPPNLPARQCIPQALTLGLP